MSSVYLMIALVVAIACVLSAGMWLLCAKSPFKDASTVVQRVVVGVVFGCAAALSTHLGIPMGGAVINVRDAFPLIAALFFDPWAGIIAGVIGGAERFVAGQFFGVGSYTTTACSLSTAIAGLLGAIMSIKIFEGRKPSAFYALAIGAIVEDFHMLMVMLTHLDDTARAFSVVQLVSMPMIIATSVAVMLSAVLISALSGAYSTGFHKTSASEKTISWRFQFWLLVFIIAMFSVTFWLTYTAETQSTIDNAKSTIALNADDIEGEMSANETSLAMAKSLLASQAKTSARSVANDVNYMRSQGTLSNARLQDLAELYNVYEIDVIGEDGIISYCTNESYVGFDMASGEQSRAFLVLLDGTTTDFLQDFQPISYNSNIKVMYAGAVCDGGFVQVGYDSSRIEQYDSLVDLGSTVKNRHIGQNGFALLLDSSGTVASGQEDLVGTTIDGMVLPGSESGDIYFFTTIADTPCYCLSRTIGEQVLVVAMPTKEVYADRDFFAYEMAFIYTLLFSLIFILVYQLVRTLIVRNLEEVNASLDRITGGNLDEVVDVRTSSEFVSLSNDINTTVSALKDFISQAEARIDAELEFARSIQLSALPAERPYPDRTDFDLSAMMYTAKEVGGDFYDYFFIDDSHLALVIADVSGKGIPAALFMMKSKTLIKSLASAGALSPAQVLEMANHELCDRNEADMFVTAWLGILDVETGRVSCSNAGHEYPVIRRSGGKFELLMDKHGFVLGGMDGVRYHDYEIELRPGDDLFLYTDGAPESTDKDNQLYGCDRMLAGLDAIGDLPSEKMLVELKADIDRFVGDAPQFDDITMICLRFKETPDLKGTLDMNGLEHLELQAEDSGLDHVQEFVETIATGAGATPKELMQVSVSVEEIFVNIAHYAYGGKPGPCTVECGAADGLLTIRFTDEGMHYNPLARTDPDIALPTEERDVGGLGIFLVKKYMDAVSYEYEGGKNILTLEKKIG